MASNTLLTGKARRHGGGRKAWHAKLIKPSKQYKNYRVWFKSPNPATGEWKETTRSPEENTEDAARGLFASIEAWLDGTSDVAPVTRAASKALTIEVLADMTIEAHRAARSVRTTEGRECINRVHITPRIGNVEIAKWRLEQSELVMTLAATTCGVGRLSDIRTFMSLMRKQAHLRGLLPRTIDPLDGLPALTPRDKYVDVRYRPDFFMLEAVAEAADLLVAEDELFARFPFLGTKYRLAGLGGLRLGEQNGVRPWDLRPSELVVMVNGSWTQPRRADSAPFRGPVKNRKIHDVPVPQSLMDQLVIAAMAGMGLPSTTSVAELENLLEQERLRRLRRADNGMSWFEVPVDPVDETWMFVDTTTGLPTRLETHNSYWHKVRRHVEKHDPDRAWPKFIPYRNMRHHAAMFWHTEFKRSWAEVAHFLGDKASTVEAHYVLPSASLVASTAEQMRGR